MSRRWSMLACLLLLAGCHLADQSATADVSATPSVRTAPIAAVPSAIGKSVTLARYDGYAGVRFGMDEAAFGRAWLDQRGLGELKGAPGPDSSCFYKTPTRVQRPADFAFMFEHGHFVRYDVGTAREVAPGGGEVGMDEAQIRALYGARVQVQAHKYVEGAHYLRVPAAQGSDVLLFETDAQGTVMRWRVGVPPQVDYVEGCA